MMHTPDRSWNILFAGGCHVIGYPVGEDRSFPSLVRQSLAASGVTATIHRLAYLPLSRPSRLADECAAVRPDLVVFQLGHFELSGRLSAYLMSALGRRVREHSKSSSMTPACPIASPVLFEWKSELKAALDRVLGHPLVDFDRFEHSLGKMAAVLANSPGARALLLTPLPCADPLSLYYRRASRAAFGRAAAARGFDFVDVLECGPHRRPRRFGPDEFYFDAIHLGAAGHVAVANAVSAALVPLLKPELAEALR